MKSVFRVMFDHNLPRWLDAGGYDLVHAASWLEPVSEDTTNVRVLIEAEEATMAEIKATSAWEWLEDLGS